MPRSIFTNSERLAQWSGVLALTIAVTGPACAKSETVPVLVNETLSIRETCSSLSGTPLMGGKVTSAILEAVSPEMAGSATTVGIPGSTLTRERPTHCLVNGVLNNRTGIDGKPYGIRFELRLPAEWNGRFLFQGGGGMDGRIVPADGAIAGQRWSAEKHQCASRREILTRFHLSADFGAPIVSSQCGLTSGS